jgi:hypothetical protein
VTQHESALREFATQHTCRFLLFEPVHRSKNVKKFSKHFVATQPHFCTQSELAPDRGLTASCCCVPWEEEEEEEGGGGRREVVVVVEEEGDSARAPDSLCSRSSTRCEHCICQIWGLFLI